MIRRRLILASRSKGRAMLLRRSGIAFEQIDPPYADPPHPPEGEPEQVAMALARRKLESLTEPIPADAVVLTADTLVLMPDGSLAGTPTTRDEARTMIKAMLSERHAIITGVALQAGGETEPMCFADRAEVFVGEVNDDQLEQYIQSDQWQGKAGGYNLFDRRDAGWPVEVDGDEATVVGLPVAILKPELRRRGVGEPARAVPGAAILTLPYRAGVSIRNWMFDCGLRKSSRLPRKTMAVGNLTAGGTGKTPTVIALARRLIDLGEHPAILLRGYKSVAGRSDEALVYADELGSSVEVEPDPDRVAGAEAVVARNPDVTCFLLDDAFQHRQVERDVNIVLLDATNPFGGDALLPAGLLREPVNNIRRADAVIVTRADQGTSVDAIDRRIEQVTDRKPIAHAAHRWTHFIDAAGEPHPLTHLAGQHVLGLCAIGNSGAFEDSLATHVGRAHLLSRPDHHHWQAGEIREAVAEHRPDAIVTTNKDWVKIRELNLQLDVPIYRPLLEIVFLDGEDAVDAMLRRFVDAAKRD